MKLKECLGALQGALRWQQKLSVNLATERISCPFLNNFKLKGNLFYFSVYVFTREPLDIERKNIIMRLLGELYGGTIEVVINPEESPAGGYYWSEASRYIKDKSTNPKAFGYAELKYITSFVMSIVPEELKIDMGDAKLSNEEYKIRAQLENYGLTSLTMPIIQGGLEDPEFSRGWGLWSDEFALITLVESNN